jgi:hypothetical protein
MIWLLVAGMVITVGFCLFVYAVSKMDGVIMSEYKRKGR